MSVHDVVGVMELDLRRPGYGESLAQTVAREVPKEPEEPAEVEDTSCARCRAACRGEAK